MWWMSFLIGFFVLLLAVFFFPIISQLFVRGRNPTDEVLEQVHSLDVLIPCHNEEGRLRETLKSVVTAIRNANRLFPDLNVNVSVGLDACSDNTVLDTHGFRLKAMAFSYKSKWKVLRSLVSASTADWVALVDAGTVWDPRLLRNCHPLFERAENMCVAPRYQTLNAGLLARAYWRLEAFLKCLENKSGGPVSVHGATVFYRRKDLLEALTLLEGREWINDDVVIPMALRIVSPEKRIVYAQNQEGGFSVQDTSLRLGPAEVFARKRIARGNLQWIGHLVPVMWEWSPLVLLISLRRAVRLFWCVIPLSLIASMNIAAWEYTILTRNPAFALVTLIVSVVPVIALSRQPAFAASWLAIRTFLGRGRNEEDEVRWS
ncbi:MAG: glycosyltransferase [Silvanigrellaceae bacterium]